MDYIYGTSGDDVLIGTGGQDIIAGSAGADTIDGGDGNDVLYSGDQSSGTIYLNTPPPALDIGTEVDTLRGDYGDDILFAGYGDNVDGGYGFDEIYVSFQGAQQGVTFDINLSSQTIGGGIITGLEAAGWVQGSNYDDTIILGVGYSNSPSGDAALGMGGNDKLIGGYQTGFLSGGDGDDFVDGRNSDYLREVDGDAGNDIIFSSRIGGIANGGEGNDTIYIYNGVTAHGGIGDDIISTLFTIDPTQTAFIGGDDGNDVLRGGNASDVLDGGSGNDVLSGNLGYDRLTGGTGDDTFLFGQGDGHDTITDLTSGDIVRVDTYNSAQSIEQLGSDVLVVFSSTDQITFQSTDIATVQAGLLFGSMPTNDTLSGGSEENIIRGWGGDDIISGGEGSDLLAGDSGADVIDGGAGDDFLFSAGFSPRYGLDIGVGLDKGTELDTLRGGDGSDSLYIGYGDNADGGPDGMFGDTLYISFQGAPHGINFDFSLDTQVFGGGTITGFESVSWVEGSNFDDTINTYRGFGRGFSAIVFGMGGNDMLIGGLSTTILDGGDGNDIIDGRLGCVEIEGGAGDDTIYMPLNGGSTANGGDGNDIIYASSYLNSAAHGGAGDDTIHIVNSSTSFVGLTTGDDGDDFIDCLNGKGRIDGGAGNDTIVCGNNVDVLIGGDGNDILSGGGGLDSLTGGAGSDTFKDTADGLNGDTITDFSHGDRIVFTDAMSQSFHFELSGNVLTYSGGSLTLSGLQYASLSASSALEGGVQIIFSVPPIVISPHVLSSSDVDGLFAIG